MRPIIGVNDDFPWYVGTSVPMGSGPNSRTEQNGERNCELPPPPPAPAPHPYAYPPPPRSHGKLRSMLRRRLTGTGVGSNFRFVSDLELKNPPPAGLTHWQSESRCSP
jgi:hypothetical protein